MTAGERCCGEGLPSPTVGSLRFGPAVGLVAVCDEVHNSRGT